MKIKLISVGKIKADYLKAGIIDYYKRINAYVSFELIEVDDEKIPLNASNKEEIKVKEAEGDKILAKVKKDDFVIAFDLDAQEYDSLDFSIHLNTLINNGRTAIVFIIGGSLGLGYNIKERANERITLSKMTFPHQLVKLIILEQIYRAYKIMKSEIYHK